MRSATWEASPSGFRMERDSTQAQAPLSTRPSSEPAASSRMPWRSEASAASRASATRLRWYSAMAFTAAA